MSASVIRASDTPAEPKEGDVGICRTCGLPIYFEHTDRGPDYLPRTGWSDRHRVDALVCFKAVDYQHVPLTGREAAIWDRAYQCGLADGGVA